MPGEFNVGGGGVFSENSGTASRQLGAELLVPKEAAGIPPI